MKQAKQANRFCKCVKHVRATVKTRPGQSGTKGKEQAAIAICVKSVLQSKGRTLKKFKCRKTGKKGPMLKTQALINE
jgi:hypothetical protein